MGTGASTRFRPNLAPVDGVDRMDCGGQRLVQRKKFAFLSQKMIKFTLINRNCMKLSKDQIRIIKSVAIYVGTTIVFYPLAMLLFDKPMTWNDYFLFAGIIIGLGVLLGLFFTIGSKVPRKEDQ